MSSANKGPRREALHAVNHFFNSLRAKKFHRIPCSCPDRISGKRSIRSGANHDELAGRKVLGKTYKIKLRPKPPGRPVDQPSSALRADPPPRRTERRPSSGRRPQAPRGRRCRSGTRPGREPHFPVSIPIIAVLDQAPCSTAPRRSRYENRASQPRNGGEPRQQDRRHPGGRQHRQRTEHQHQDRQHGPVFNATPGPSSPVTHTSRHHRRPGAHHQRQQGRRDPQRMQGTGRKAQRPDQPDQGQQRSQSPDRADRLGARISRPLNGVAITPSQVSRVAPGQSPRPRTPPRPARLPNQSNPVATRMIVFS